MDEPAVTVVIISSVCLVKAVKALYDMIKFMFEADMSGQSEIVGVFLSTQMTQMFIKVVTFFMDIVNRSA